MEEFLKKLTWRRTALWISFAFLAVLTYVVVPENPKQEQFNDRPVKFWVKSLGTRGTDESVLTWVSFGTNAIPHLFRALGKGPPTERAYGTLYERLPSSIKSKLPVPVPRKAIRYNAANVLRDFGPEAISAVPALAAALSDPDVKLNAALALGSIGPSARSAIPQLLLGLDDPAIQNNCLNALSGIGIRSSEGIAKIITLLDGGSDDLKRGALAALGTVTSVNTEVDQAFKRALGTGSKNIRINAIIAAGKRGAASASLIPVILDLSSNQNDSSNDFQYQAIRTFGQIGHAAIGAIPWLKQMMLQTTNEFVRLSAAESIWSIQPGDPESEAGLRACLNSDNIDVKRWCAKSMLDKIPEMREAKRLLIDHERSDDEFLRVIASVAAWVNETNGPPPIEPLLRFLEQPPKRAGGVIYLSNHSMMLDLFRYFGASARGAVPRLKALRASDNELLRREAAKALAAVEGRPLWPP